MRERRDESKSEWVSDKERVCDLNAYTTRVLVVGLGESAEKSLEDFHRHISRFLPKLEEGAVAESGTATAPATSGKKKETNHAAVRQEFLERCFYVHGQYDNSGASMSICPVFPHAPAKDTSQERALLVSSFYFLKVAQCRVMFIHLRVGRRVWISSGDIESLKEFLDSHAPPDMPLNRLFYLSLPPNIFNVISELVGEILRSKRGWNRLVVEKVRALVLFFYVLLCPSLPLHSC